jgi:hypothetical protein
VIKRFIEVTEKGDPKYKNNFIVTASDLDNDITILKDLKNSLRPDLRIPFAGFSFTQLFLDYFS